jgi:hypothetical protein
VIEGKQDFFGEVSKEPSSFEELFVFYQDFVKVFYSTVQSENELPVEILFEINAALDHVSRHYIYEEEEEKVVRKAYSHLKRACLDGFKIVLRETLKKADELEKVDLSLIDNGEFEQNLRKLVSDIKAGAIDARRLEGSPLNQPSETGVPAFDRWLPVMEKCLQLEQDYYLHTGVSWAKKKSMIFSWKGIIASALIGSAVTLLLEGLLG